MIDYFKLAKASIFVTYECPMCNYDSAERSDVEAHIDRFHTIKEINEMCSE